MARSGRIVMISDAAGVARVADRLAFGIEVPSCDPFVAPLLIAEGFFEEIVVRGQHDDRHLLVDQRDWPVLHFARGGRRD